MLRPRLPAGARVAIVAASDRLALAAQRTVKSRRKAEVVAILGFDDILAAAAARLTTMRQGHFAKGEAYAQAALDGIEPQVNAGAARRAREPDATASGPYVAHQTVLHSCSTPRAPVYSYWPVTPLRSSPAVPASMARCSPGASRASSCCRRCRSARARTRLPCCTNSMPR